MCFGTLPVEPLALRAPRGAFLMPGWDLFINYLKTFQYQLILRTRKKAAQPYQVLRAKDTMGLFLCQSQMGQYLYLMVLSLCSSQKAFLTLRFLYLCISCFLLALACFLKIQISSPSGIYFSKRSETGFQLNFFHRKTWVLNPDTLAHQLCNFKQIS